MPPALPPRLRALLLFAAIGTAALFVDIGVLYAVRPWLGSYGGRALSFLAAASFTWLLNRHITFAGAKRHSLWAEYTRYIASMGIGGAANYAVYAAAVALWPAAARQPAIGVALGSLAGLAFNFVAASKIMAPPDAAAAAPDAQRKP